VWVRAAVADDGVLVAFDRTVAKLGIVVTLGSDR
jgi:hypothetical protein